ncbi:ribonucleotide reductase subunit alpha [Pseudoalteromonas sp. KG3]|uniref:ribonucleotide reductase subunit alpha n=1 Tax=Pseudoalteromonas TaxID=53246 RepID=UPI00214784D3|nr:MULTISPECIES: ribonucleotide reductase subunit alpha [Pseudoalteromonas]WKD25511.1 ribonucleotide reductase subunit alpha [Pseudoalteromonas sp. KG3]
MITQFKDLLSYAKEQPDPQRLLFLFAKTELSNPNKSKKNAKGTITPTMCVDKLPNEIVSYESLIKEADNISKEWDFVFISSLSGVKGQPPSTEDADPYLNKMTNDVTSGQNIARYVVFDRQDNPIELLPN